MTMGNVPTTFASSAADTTLAGAAAGQSVQKTLVLDGLAAQYSNLLRAGQMQIWRLALQTQGKLIAAEDAADPAAPVPAWLDCSVYHRDIRHLLERCVQLNTDSQQRAVAIRVPDRGLREAGASTPAATVSARRA